MNKFTLSLLCLFCLASTLIGQNIRKGKDYALFFAVNDYSQDNTWSDLKNPIKDAEAIAGLLEKYYSFETEIYKDPNLRQIEQVFAAWQKKSFAEDAQLFVFFSGHGYFHEFNKNGYFVPSDGEDTNYRTFFELSDIGNIVTQIPCKHILLAIDACYSGTIDQAIAFKGRPSVRRPGQTEQSVAKQFIEKQLAFKSRLLVTSGGKERTPDGVEHSPFAGAVIDGLQTAYQNGEALFTYQDLLAQLARVNPTPHHGQLAGHQNGSFVFVTDSKKPEPEKSGLAGAQPLFLETFDVTFVGTEKDRLWKNYQDGAWNVGINRGRYCYSNQTQNSAVEYKFLYIPNRDLSNFPVSVELQTQNAPAGDPVSSGGLMYRFWQRGETAYYYAFTLSAEGVYKFYKRNANGFQTLFTGKAEHFRPGASNKLSIAGAGSQFQLYINDQLATVIEDDELKMGDTGLIAIGLGEHCFDNIEIHEKK